MDKTTRNQNATKRAVAYARTSSKQGPTKESCIEAQFEAIQQYAQANGFEIVEYFYDIGKSAHSAKQTGLQEMIRFATDEWYQIDYVIAQSMSRLSRNTLSFCVDIQSKLKPAGVHVRSATEPVDETPEGQFKQSLLLGIAQYHSDFHRELNQRHRASALREG